MFYLVKTNQFKQGAEVIETNESAMILKSKMYDLELTKEDSSKYFVTNSDNFITPFDTVDSSSIIYWC